MKIRSQLLCAAALVLGTGAAVAQDIIIAPEQEVVIREYVKKDPLASIKLPGIELNVGTELPETVVRRRVESTDYEYVVIDDRTVIVEPATRKVIRILE